MKGNIYRTHHCIDIDSSLIGKTITVSGWVENIRDHGGVLFLDLRDNTETLQTVSNDDSLFTGLAKESVVKLTGKIRKRSEDTYNNNLKTGEVELLVSTLEVLSPSLHELPFSIRQSITAGEDVRLKYRYLDMRNEKVQEKIKLRSEILYYLRNKMHDIGFTEVQTPILTASSPEGARDFVVPSRVYPGKFYALPQAPQIYKELLMVGGFEKYFQIAPCFRDEDPRADRTLEFYQLDLEMSFVDEEDVLNVGEEIFYDTFTKFSNKKVSPRPFRRIAYRDAIDLYGTDKPDLRYDMTISDVTDVFKNSEFVVFKTVLEQNGIINAIVAKNCADKYSRKDLDNLTDFAKSKKASGLAYLKFNEEITGSIAKVVTEDELIALKKTLKIENNDLVLIISGNKKIVKSALGQVRIKVAEDMNMIDKDRLELCIINDFPMFEWDEYLNKWDFCHNPFSLPHGGIKDYDEKETDDILAYQYDFVCNGYEMASGAVRNHDVKIMEKVFSLIGYDESVIKEKFASLYTAFHYGAPPHAGMAIGIERLLMLLLDEESIREVVTFPMSASGIDMMMGSPSAVDEKQLREVHIKLR